MILREAIASILATVLFFVPLAVLLFIPGAPDPNDSWQRGVVVAPLIFTVAVPILSSSARFLISKGLHTAFRFSFGAFVLTGGLVVALITPAIIIGTFVGLFSFASAALGGLVLLVCASVASIPASLVWWWLVAHHKSSNSDIRQQASPAAGAH